MKKISSGEYNARMIILTYDFDPFTPFLPFSIYYPDNHLSLIYLVTKFSVTRGEYFNYISQVRNLGLTTKSETS